MDPYFVNFFLDELYESHGYFEYLVSELKEANVDYSYDKLIKVENNSYQIVYSSLITMNNSLNLYDDYLYLYRDFFMEKKRIYVKWFSLYIASILILKYFGKNLTSKELNDMWYILFDVIMGVQSVYFVNNNLLEYHNKNKEIIEKIDQVKKDYDDSFKKANREIQYIISLNRVLQNELDKKKTLTMNCTP